MKYVILAAALAACTIPERDYTGATIRMQLTSNGFGSVQDDTAMPAFTLGSVDTKYSVEIEIFTTSGGEMTQSMSTSSKVTSVATTFAVGGMAVPSPAFESDNSVLDPKFTSTAPIVIPGSSKGSIFEVHGSATDGNDLESNLIDMQITLK